MEITNLAPSPEKLFHSSIFLITVEKIDVTVAIKLFTTFVYIETNIR